MLEIWNSPSSAPILHGLKVILVCGGKAYELISCEETVLVTEIKLLESKQKKMDSRVVLYFMYSREAGYTTARVKSPDTNMFFHTVTPRV